MPIRVGPTDWIRTMIDELFAEERELPEILEEVARLGVQLRLQRRCRERSPSLLAANGINEPPRHLPWADGSREWVPAGDGEDHHWRGHLEAAETAWQHRQVRVAAVRQARDDDERPRRLW